MTSQATELQNPLLTARFELGFTQFDVADALGVTRNFIVRAESAEYPEPPKNLVEYYAQGDPNRAVDLTHGYLAYQIRMRQESFGLLYPYFTEPAEYLNPYGPSLVHPLTFWARRTTEITPESVPSYPLAPTLYSLCRAFCVHHAVMHRWVTDTTGTVKKVPKTFLAALFESGYNETSLIALEGAYELYRS